MPEDQYLVEYAFFYYYHIAHMVKHFEEGGCGIRPLLDLWILNHRVPFHSADREMLLEKGNLLVFGKAAELLSEVWFSCAPHNDISKQMEEYLLFGGVYGNLENRISVQQLKKGGKVRYVLAKIFPPYRMLKTQFPILEKHWYLTPFFVVVRGVKWLLHGDSERMKQELNMNSKISKTKAEQTADLLNKLGL